MGFVGVTPALRPYGGETLALPDVAGLVLWLEDNYGLYQEDGGAASGVGDPVGFWMDQSGLNNHLSQSVADDKPTRRADGVEFDGSDDVLVIDTFTGITSQPFTMFHAVEIVTGYTAQAGIACNYDGAVNNQWMVRATSTRRQNVFCGSNLNSAANFAVDTIFVGTARLNSTSSLTAINDTESSGNAGTSTGFDGVALGRSPSAFLSMKIRAVLIYDSLLLSADRQSVRDYLTAKYL